MPRPLRSSCDRCHSQKLKCPKQPGSETCTRCLKAGADCVFSQARPPGPTPQRTALDYEAAIAHQPPLEERADIHLGWPLFDLEDAFPSPSQVAHGIQPDQSAQAASENPRSAYVRRLTTLAADIDQLSLDLPRISMLHVTQDNAVEGAYAQYDQEISRFQPRRLEQVFASAQQLIDLYQDAPRQLFDQPGAAGLTECHNPDCIHTMDIPEELDTILCTPDEPPDRVDAFLFNLLTACHSKVVDIFMAILANARFCAKLATSPHAHEARVDLPELRVGNFVVSSTSASSMQILLLVHILSTLVDQIQRLRTGVENVYLGADDYHKSRGLLLLQCDLLEERTRAQMNRLDRLRDGLVKLGLVR